MAAAESTSRPCRCGRCTLTRCRPAALSCRNVVFSPWREERESSVRQRVAAERGQRHLAEPGYLRAWGRHPATLTQAHEASNRRLPVAAAQPAASEETRRRLSPASRFTEEEDLTHYEKLRPRNDVTDERGWVTGMAEMVTLNRFSQCHHRHGPHSGSSRPDFVAVSSEDGGFC